MHLPRKTALLGVAAAAVALSGCAWMDRNFGTNFTNGAAYQSEPYGPPQTMDNRTSAATTPERQSTASASDAYEEQEIVDAVADFFGVTAEAAGAAVARVFREQGRPVGYIRGEEVAGAVGVGLRYGEGDLQLRNGTTRKVYWQGPSIGFDTGVDASKVFTLVYDLQDADAIYQRFPGVAGSAYFIGGIGVNYQQNGDIILAPMRAGIGLRAGVNVGYLHYTRERQILPL